jgi:hypothetical protein
MNALLVKVVQAHQRDWSRWLPYVVSAYNGSTRGATGHTPNFLIFARERSVASTLFWATHQSRSNRLTSLLSTSQA